jgi:hypothetical protein
MLPIVVLVILFFIAALAILGIKKSWSWLTGKTTDGTSVINDYVRISIDAGNCEVAGAVETDDQGLETNVSYIICHNSINGSEYRFMSPPINKDADTVRFYLLKQGKIALSYDKNKLENYSFDISFLDR